jgi:hypothetical protein
MTALPPLPFGRHGGALPDGARTCRNWHRPDRAQQARPESRAAFLPVNDAGCYALYWRIGRPSASRLLCYGAGVASTALLVALKLTDLRPDSITFADLLSEKSETMEHLDRMQSVLAQWG